MLACAVLTFPVYRDYLLHEYQLFQESRIFRQIKHPPGSSRVAFKQHLGLFFGNGNHCDFFIGEIRRYSGDQQAIKSFYSEPAGMDISILFIENGEFPEDFRLNYFPYTYDSLSDWLDSPNVPRDHLYLLYNSGFLDLNPGRDFRCS
jgi:hypothetical protein